MQLKEGTYTTLTLTAWKMEVNRREDMTGKIGKEKKRRSGGRQRQEKVTAKILWAFGGSAQGCRIRKAGAKGVCCSVGGS